MARCEAQQFKSEALSRGGNSSTEKLGKAGYVRLICKFTYILLTALLEYKICQIMAVIWVGQYPILAYM